MAPPRAARPPMRRSHYEPDPEGRAEEPEQAGSFPRQLGHIGGGGMGHGEGPPGGAVDDRAANSSQMLPASPVRPLATAVPASARPVPASASGPRGGPVPGPAYRIARPKTRRPTARWSLRRRPEPARVERKQGEDHAEADEVDGDRGPQIPNPGGTRRRAALHDAPGGSHPPNRPARVLRVGVRHGSQHTTAPAFRQVTRVCLSGRADRWSEVPLRASRGENGRRDAPLRPGADGPDVHGLQALGALLHVELDRLTFFKAAEAVHLNGGMMRRHQAHHWAAR